jgi:hypothetical protein
MAWRGRLVFLIAGAMVVVGACSSPPQVQNSYGYVGREVQMPGLTNITAVTVGDKHACAVRTNQTALCWGANRNGEFGNGLTNQTYTLVPSGVQSLSGVVSLSTGLDHTCAVVSGGAVKCWGANGRGQLGGPLSNPELTPKANGVTGALSVAAGGHFTCALMGDGTVECWGANDVGQLGNPLVSGDSSSPVQVADITDATALAVGTWSACAIRTGGAVSCWGYEGSNGLLGDGGMWDPSSFTAKPVDVSGLVDATSVSIRSTPDIDDGNSCASLKDGSVWCWGRPILGNGTPNGSPIPVQVSGLADATSVSGGTVPCALRANLNVDCWGDDTVHGYLGDGKTTPVYAPIAVHHVIITTSLSTGTNSNQTCAVNAAKLVMCWGITDY